MFFNFEDVSSLTQATFIRYDEHIEHTSAFIATLVKSQWKGDELVIPKEKGHCFDGSEVHILDT